MTELPRPRPVPRPLVGPDGVLSGLSATPLAGAAGVAGDVVVTGVTHASGQVREGDLYAGLPGEHTHGARYASQAADRGAVALLTDPAGAELAEPAGLPTIVVPAPRSVLGEVAARVYGRPGDDLLIVGVTGTNGKTTLTHLLVAALRAGGHRTGVIGTVGTQIGDSWIGSVRTTPESTDLHALLAVMREDGVSAVAMEVSSHALVLGRVDAVPFDVAVFTNLSQDHLDFHGDMAHYFAAKSTLFDPARSAAAVICIDDQWGRRLAGSVALPTMTYGWGEGADWRGALEPGGPPGRSTVAVHGPGGTAVVLEVGLPGDFNAANALGALAAAAAAGVAPQAAAAGIGGCPGVPGRMERVSDPDPGRGLVALVDYAHTPDAVSRAVAAVPATARRVVVLGAGGDRDRHKRADMGRAAAETADVVIVTDDNPRSEDPALIRAAVAAGATGAGRARVEVVAGRAAAIEAAVAAARPGDVVLVLGKGHEQGQEIDGVVHDFDDRVALAAALRGGAGP